MSMRCDDVRPLLAELVYEEVEPAIADKLREHLGTCLGCRRHQMAFMAVRTDLQEWQPAGSGSHGMRFITPDNGRAPAPIWHSRAFQGLAAAAAFGFVAVLTAAGVNLQVHSGPDGWVMTTSFGEPQSLQEAPPPVVALEQIPALNSWFDARFDTQLDNQLGNRLADHGVVTLASMPEQQFFSDAQVQELHRRVTGVLDNTLAERDLELGARFDDMEYRFNTNLDMQASNFIYTLTSLVDGMEAEHRDQIFQVTQYYESLVSDTERKVDEHAFRLDNLELSLAAASRSPEQ